MEQRDYYIEQATVELRIGFGSERRNFADMNRGGCATGFYVRKTGLTHLVTNWHVVTGNDFITRQSIMGDEVPTHLVVNEWVTRREYTIELYQNGKAIWNQHTTESAFEERYVGVNQVMRDVVTIPVITSVHPIDLIPNIQPSYQRLEPHDPVIVLGYPFSRERAIWKTGHVAESVQPSQDYFLVNGRTKKGMSGSGVFSSHIRLLSNNMPSHVLLGIYSARIDDRGYMDHLNDLDIGVVWKPDLLVELLP